MPFFLSHLLAVGPEPMNVGFTLAAGRALGGAGIDGPVLKEFPAVQIGMVLAKRDQIAREIQQLAAVFVQIPVEQACWVVLVVAVVIAVLVAADFTSAANHRHALRDQKRGQKVALLPRPQLPNFRIARGPLHAAIPGIVIVCSVAVIFLVRFIVFFLITHQVREREAVVRGDKVDAGAGASAVALI